MLCCQINPVVRCIRCNIMGCEDHRYDLEEQTCPKPYGKGTEMFFINHATVMTTAKRYD